MGKKTKQRHESRAVAKRARLGLRSYTLGSARLGEMRDSSSLARLLRSANAARSARGRLRARFWADGYLLLRGLLPAEVVRQAQSSLLAKLPSFGPSREDAGAGLCSPEVLAVLNHSELFYFLDSFFEEVAAPVFDSANLRAVQPGQSTGFHTDSVYMGKLMAANQPPVVACWIPITPIPVELGGLVVCRGSNSHPGFEHFRQTYGKLDLDESDIKGTGWFTDDPEEVISMGGRWETAEYLQGDVVLFTMHTVHGSSANCLDRWRLSLDFRVQAGSAPPVEPSCNKGRWSRFRHNMSEFPQTMEQAKAAWKAFAPGTEPELASWQTKRSLRSDGSI
ncbi:unnamed protein product [Effrenium voratum]|nr:unnamed protein product [Effrenium voratum]